MSSRVTSRSSVTSVSPICEVVEVLGERVGALVALRALDELAADRGQQLGRALDRRALQVVPHAAQAAQLLAAAGATGSAVHQVRERRAVARVGAAAALVDDQHPAVVAGDAEREVAGLGKVRGEHRRDQAAVAQRREVDRVVEGVVAQDRGDRAERLDGVDRRGIGLRCDEQRGREERAALGVGAEELGVAVGHDLGIGGQGGDGAAHLVALVEAGQRAHAHVLAGGVADRGLRQSLAERVGDRVDHSNGHQRASHRGALLAGLDRQLAGDLLDVEVELGRAGPRGRRQDRGVEAVGLRREPHRARHDRGVRAQLRRGRRGAREADEVLAAEVVEEIADRAQQQLRRTIRENPAGDQLAERGGGHERGRRRRLRDHRHPREERRRQLLQHAPHREVEGVDVHRDALQRHADVTRPEAAVLGEELGRAVEQHAGVGQLPPALGRVREEHADPAVDVDLRVRARAAGVHGERVELVLALVERLRELLEQPRTIVERQRPQCRTAHPARVVQHRRDVRPSARERGDLRAVHRTVQRAPTAAANPLTDGVALQRHGAHGLHPRSAARASSARSRGTKRW